MVLANLNGDDLILCQITSQSIRDNYAIALADTDFVTGSLNQPSNIDFYCRQKHCFAKNWNN